MREMTGNPIDIDTLDANFSTRLEEEEEEGTISERPAMDDRELYKVLLKMRNRVRKFEDLMCECFRRDREDNVPEGWLSKGEIALFEDDMKNLVDDALRIERKTCNG